MGRYIKRFAFTLAEAVIVLVLLSIIAAKIIPSVDATRPSTEKVLLKSANAKLNQAVSELLANENLYPFDEELAILSMTCNGTGVPEICSRGLFIPVLDPFATNAQNFVSNTLCDASNIDTDKGYFARTVCSIMNPIEANCTDEDNCTFTTPDGMRWTVQRRNGVTFNSIYNGGNCNCSLKGDNTILYQAIVDVNGPLEPNTETDVNIPDIYRFDIHYDGTVRIHSTPEEHTGRDILANPLSNKRRPDLEDNRFDGGH